MTVPWQCRGTAEESVADSKQPLCCQKTSGSIHFQHRLLNCVQLRGGQDLSILAAELESCAPVRIKTGGEKKADY
jgi:Flp pilus assembly CpaE family ATPase